MKAKDIIKYLESLAMEWESDTVDTVKTGNPECEVKRVVSTFMATADIIGQARDLGADMIITHEPTFYSHTDGTSRLQDDPVYLAKKELIGDLVIYRCHDGIHSWEQDGIYRGVNRKLGWESYVRKVEGGFSGVYDLPETDGGTLSGHLVRALGCPGLRYVGKMPRVIRTAALAVGACGGEWQLELCRRYKPDVIICGEVHEWELPEYVRDANDLGQELGLIVTGHLESEQEGMVYLAELLKKKFSGLDTVFLEGKGAFTSLPR